MSDEVSIKILERQKKCSINSLKRGIISLENMKDDEYVVYCRDDFWWIWIYLVTLLELETGEIWGHDFDRH